MELSEDEVTLVRDKDVDGATGEELDTTRDDAYRMGKRLIGTIQRNQCPISDVMESLSMTSKMDHQRRPTTKIGTALWLDNCMFGDTLRRYYNHEGVGTWGRVRGRWRES